MQVLEVYFNGSKDYFLLSRGVVDALNTLVRPSELKYNRLDESTECNWTVSAANLRQILAQACTISDATNLMRMIILMGSGPARLSALSWQNMVASGGVWYDLKPQFRKVLEEQGITDGTFILQGV